MVSFARKIGILSRHSRSIITPLSFAATLTKLAPLLCGKQSVQRWMDGENWWEFVKTNQQNCFVEHTNQIPSISLSKRDEEHVTPSSPQFLSIRSSAMHRSLKDLHRHQLHHALPPHIAQHCPECLQKKLVKADLTPPFVITLNRLPLSMSDSPCLPLLLEHQSDASPTDPRCCLCPAPLSPFLEPRINSRIRHVDSKSISRTLFHQPDIRTHASRRDENMRTRAVNHSFVLQWIRVTLTTSRWHQVVEGNESRE
ncbi:hypothetical protein BLNAU_15228 [Blattamonas nauphoetae]|uniref:Uncharacterized protein n=1 Tax=Blattamonas nauphoetae TaxID=2049346 RepID=A0ABQ9XEV4_9EUKA|nr:hypothetical protein BLNAU_15228 [Blattamonas nauphoetae]